MGTHRGGGGSRAFSSAQEEDFQARWDNTGLEYNLQKSQKSECSNSDFRIFCSVLSFRGVLSVADTAMMRYKFFLTSSPLRLAAASPPKTNRHVRRAQIPAPLEPRQNSNHTKHVSEAKGILAASILMNSLSE